ncbi:HECT domain-containing family protein [Cryptosporidium andersoni]|uniref:HECT-type E3 ubiquitin transferase n=1 Tax=Cryptosporidium andersoni TaxID=117008 RepID=A0A1J4MSA4_9CRYT|nr:HECT domain-containing family protein [Cryptosporidium andersoni]
MFLDRNNTRKTLRSTSTDLKATLHKGSLTDKNALGISIDSNSARVFVEQQKKQKEKRLLEKRRGEMANIIRRFAYNYICYKKSRELILLNLENILLNSLEELEQDISRIIKMLTFVFNLNTDFEHYKHILITVYRILKASKYLYIDNISPSSIASLIRITLIIIYRRSMEIDLCSKRSKYNEIRDFGEYNNNSNTFMKNLFNLLDYIGRKWSKNQLEQVLKKVIRFSYVDVLFLKFIQDCFKEIEYIRVNETEILECQGNIPQKQSYSSSLQVEKRKFIEQEESNVTYTSNKIMNCSRINLSLYNIITSLINIICTNDHYRIILFGRGIWNRSIYFLQDRLEKLYPEYFPRVKQFLHYRNEWLLSYIVNILIERFDLVNCVDIESCTCISLFSIILDKLSAYEKFKSFILTQFNKTSNIRSFNYPYPVFWPKSILSYILLQYSQLEEILSRKHKDQHMYLSYFSENFEMKIGEYRKEINKDYQIIFDRILRRLLLWKLYPTQNITNINDKDNEISYNNIKILNSLLKIMNILQTTKQMKFNIGVGIILLIRFFLSLSTFNERLYYQRILASQYNIYDQKDSKTALKYNDNEDDNNKESFGDFLYIKDLLKSYFFDNVINPVLADCYQCFSSQKNFSYSSSILETILIIYFPCDLLGISEICFLEPQNFDNYLHLTNNKTINKQSTYLFSAADLYKSNNITNEKNSLDSNYMKCQYQMDNIGSVKPNSLQFDLKSQKLQSDQLLNSYKEIFSKSFHIQDDDLIFIKGQYDLNMNIDIDGDVFKNSQILLLPLCISSQVMKLNKIILEELSVVTPWVLISFLFLHSLIIVNHNGSFSDFINKSLLVNNKDHAIGDISRYFCIALFIKLTCTQEREIRRALDIMLSNSNDNDKELSQLATKDRSIDYQNLHLHIPNILIDDIRNYFKYSSGPELLKKCMHVFATNTLRLSNGIGILDYNVNNNKSNIRYIEECNLSNEYRWSCNLEHDFQYISLFMNNLTWTLLYINSLRQDNIQGSSLNSSIPQLIDSLRLCFGQTTRQLYIEDSKLHFMPIRQNNKTSIWAIPEASNLLKSRETLLKQQIHIESVGALPTIYTNSVNLNNTDNIPLYQDNDINNSISNIFDSTLRYTSTPTTERILRNVVEELPHILELEDRLGFYHHFIAEFRYQQGTQNINLITPKEIRRDYIIEDALYSMGNLDTEGLRGILRILFVDEQGFAEAGIDGGGLFKDFITCLSKELCSPSFGLFISTRNNTLVPRDIYSLTNILASSNFKEFQRLKKILSNRTITIIGLYEFLGKVVGKAIFEKTLLEVEFNPVFLNLVCHRNNNLDDLANFDQELYRSLIFIREYDDDISQLSLTFSVTLNTELISNQSNKSSNPIEIELVPNGKNIPVTNMNKLLYIQLLTQYKGTTSMKRQAEAFARGLSMVIPEESLRLFSPSELQSLICGVLKGLDVRDLKRNTNYTGYLESSPQIQWLWDILENEFDSEEQSAFLMFVTSSRKAPLLGFEHLNPKFGIQIVPEYTRLPSAATCFNLLKLPAYKSKDILYEKLRLAIFGASGFDLS